MPFKSKSQQAYLEIHEPEVAEKFEKKTKNYKSLPKHVKKKNLSEANEAGFRKGFGKK